MKKKFVAIMMVAAMAASMAACGSDGGSSDTQKGGSSTTTSDVANKDKPLVWFNRQPSNSSTGELDTTALNYNKDTYYVGFDANQGAELQGEMVKEYIEKNIDTIDRNGDGVIGYVLAIGDIGHNDSIARTRGVRKALGTGVEKDGETEIPLPAKFGTLSLSGRTEDAAYFTFESFAFPPVLLRFDGERMEIAMRSSDESYPDVVVEQLFAPSESDGKMIPYFMVRRKDVKPDGQTPTWIYGYGGYNIPALPWATDKVGGLDIARWAMQGGIYVMATLRGGSEYGTGWHEEGMMFHKKNCYGDFFGVTQKLIADGWTNPKKIVICGCSNGGLLVSTLVTMRPELFGCVIDSVPHTDMIHFTEDARGPMYITEYGNPRESKEMFEYILSYSPYHNVKQTSYPSVYIQTGECDNNVPPYHGKKFAARMQECNRSENPVLLRVLAKGSHDRGSGEAYWQTIAEAQLFVKKALGL